MVKAVGAVSCGNGASVMKVREETNAPGHWLELVLRPDGGLMADRLQVSFLKEMVGAAPPGDPACAALCMVAQADAVRALIDPAGNVGEKQFHYSRRILGQAMVFLKEGGKRDVAADAVKRGLLGMLETVNRREAAIREVETFLNSPYAEDQAQFAVNKLEADCNAILSRADQEACIEEFWRLWELVWALLLTQKGDEGVHRLREIFDHNPWLERREGERQGLTPPGGLIDPDERDDEDDNVDLF